MPIPEPPQVPTVENRDHRQEPTVTDLGAASCGAASRAARLGPAGSRLVAAVRKAGLDRVQIAAVLGLPDAAAAQERFQKLWPRLDAPVDEVQPPEPGNGRPGNDGAPGSDGPTG
ncbi:hypothetical protein GCM10009735_37810 [Actinomadura chokoriensis]